jgi:peptide/nickel transport system permease protein
MTAPDGVPAVAELPLADLGAAVGGEQAGRPEISGLRRFLSIGSARAGLAGVTVVLCLAIFGPLFAPDGPGSIVAPAGTLPSAKNLLGTDYFGRDVLSRFLYGGASVIVLPLVAVSLALLLGGAVGLVSGYLGGAVDAVVVRAIDIVLSIPNFLLVIVVMAGFGTGEEVVVIAVALVYAPSIARVIRAATQAVAPREFVLAARARGDSLRWIVFREIAPNIVPTLLVEVALRLTFGILFIASLSFLGLGVQPPSPNWGVMVSENRDLLSIQPYSVLVPAAAIAVLAISINLIADALTKHFGGSSGGEAI